ncbi:MAG TPA: hypothetical protein VK150_06990, partial [Geothrix sp.]|nr:hypothetical protein [Geothrix sp.]
SLALKEEGAFNSRLVDAISDDVVDAAEADDLDRGISKIQQFLSAMRERLAEAKETEKAHGRPA